MRSVLVMVVMLVLGAVILVEGVTEAFGTVMCHDRVMSPGQTCITGEKYRTVVRDYPAQEARQDREGFIEIGMASFLLLVPPLVLVAYLRFKRRGTPPDPRPVPPGLERWARRRSESGPFGR